MAKQQMIYPDDKGQFLYIHMSSKEFPFLGYRGYKEELLQKPLTEKVRPYVICPVCKGLLRDAVTDGNRIVTCEGCSLGKHVKPFLAMRESIEDKEVKCLFVECRWIGKLFTVERHLEYCTYLPVRCPTKYCLEMVKKIELESHIESCLNREKTCGYCKKTGQLQR